MHETGDRVLILGLNKSKILSPLFSGVAYGTFPLNKYAKAGFPEYSLHSRAINPVLEYWGSPEPSVVSELRGNSIITITDKKASTEFIKTNL